MQSAINFRLLPYNGLKTTGSGQIIQVRNHVKMYPWRHNRNNRECYLDTTKTPYTDKHNINEFRPSRYKMKPWQKVVYKDRDNRYNGYHWHEAYVSDPVEAKETATSRLTRFTNSLRDRGQARETKSYCPPTDVEGRILKIFNEIRPSLEDGLNGSISSEESILNLNLNQSLQLKYELITRCMVEFEHELTSAHLNDMEKVHDLVEYYSTPVRGIDPYSALINKSDMLPLNLSILADAVRYDKETDEFFGGYTALPGNVSQVPGLRAKKKYQVLNQDEFQWPDI